MIRWIILAVVLAVVPAVVAQDTKKEEAMNEEQKAALKKLQEMAAAGQTSQPASQPAAAPGQHAFVKLETTLGDIVLDLDGEKAPISVKNFLDYVDAGFYNGTIFHRVMSTFMIQGGGYLPDLTEKKEGLRAPIKNEWQNGLKNVRGSIAMARTQVPDSATAQFFINVVDNAMLDEARDGAAYAVFGKVIAGLDTVDKIRNTPVQSDPKLPMGPVVPKEPVVIKSVKRMNAEECKPLVEQAAKADAAAKEAETKAKAGQEKEVQDFVQKLEQETGKKSEKTASGLISVVLKPGEGASPKPTDTVEVHYTGTLLDGKKFDSSVDRGKPATFRLNQVIKGWTEGVGLMKVGEKRKLIIPSELAYGKNPPPGSGIPANAWLVFDVELLSIKPAQ
jgi:peptidyl-prolyl cis-trans isomerase A (cyclophilin A)